MKKLITSRTILMGLFLFAAMLAWASVATAQNIGLSGEQTTLGWSETIDAGGFDYVNIGSSGNPVPIYYDPKAGPWQKTFTNFLAPLTINEAIQIAPGGPNWTNWEEQILDDPGWVWASGATLSILGGQTYNGQLSLDQQTVEFHFLSQGVGATLIINKVLQWNGSPNARPATVIVNEWPTVPEPGTLALRCFFPERRPWRQWPGGGEDKRLGSTKTVEKEAIEPSLRVALFIG